MPIRYEGPTAVFDGACTLEETVDLLEWLHRTPGGAVDLGRCTGLHTALLQALLAGRARVAVAPEDPFLGRWVAPLLTAGGDPG